MSEAWVTLRPLDVVEFRDGRPFAASLASSARTTFPRPTSTAGAIGAAFGREPNRVEGPLVLQTIGDRRSLLFTVPADLVFDEADPGLARPSDPTTSLPASGITTDLDGRSDRDGEWRLPEGRGEGLAVVLDTRQMELYLDDAPAFLSSLEGPNRLTPFSEVLRTESRIGLARSGRTARDGFLYRAEFMRFDDDATFSFACRVTFEDVDLPVANQVVRLGGEARQAEVTVIPADGPGAPRLPDPPSHFPGGRVLLYLATPAIFGGGWKPDGLGPGRVVSAVVGRPAVAASWLTGRRSAEPVRWGAPAGSVYFLQFDSEHEAAELARRHGTCLEQVDDRLRTAGFGMCLIGRW